MRFTSAALGEMFQQLLEWIAMKFAAHIHGPLWMNCNHVGDPLFFYNTVYTLEILCEEKLAKLTHPQLYLQLDCLLTNICMLTWYNCDSEHGKHFTC